MTRYSVQFGAGASGEYSADQVDHMRAAGLLDGLTVAPVVLVADLLAYAAERRWRAEVGGVVVGSLHMQTDAASQSKLAQAIQSIDLGVIPEPLPWKTARGFAVLSRADLLDAAKATAALVQAAFATEAAVAASIVAGEITTHAEVDMAPWPSAAG